jgi:hypothetical protein
VYHTCAFTGSITLGTTKQAINALADNVFKIGASNGFVLQEDMMLLGAKYSGVGAANGKLTSPKLNQFQALFLTPLDVTLASTNPHLQALWPYRPFTFRNQEEVLALGDNTDAGNQQQTVVAHFSNGIEQIPSGEILTITGTSTTAAVANSWTLLSFTLDQALPEGVYAMVASECQSTTAIAHRLTFWGQFYRPGHISTTAFTNQQGEPIRWLTFGLMGRFSNVTLPNMEVLCRTTDASHTFRWRCIKVA